MKSVTQVSLLVLLLTSSAFANQICGKVRAEGAGPGPEAGIEGEIEAGFQDVLTEDNSQKVVITGKTTEISAQIDLMAGAPDGQNIACLDGELGENGSFVVESIASETLK